MHTHCLPLLPQPPFHLADQDSRRHGHVQALCLVIPVQNIAALKGVGRNGNKAVQRTLNLVGEALALAAHHQDEPASTIRRGLAVLKAQREFQVVHALALHASADQRNPE